MSSLCDIFPDDPSCVPEEPLCVREPYNFECWTPEITYQLEVGEILTWHLPDPRKKGFSWIFNDECNDILDFDLDVDPPIKSGSKKPGDPLYTSATGKATGNCTLSLAYAEQWDFGTQKNVEDAKVLTKKITVVEPMIPQEDVSYPEESVPKTKDEAVEKVTLTKEG